MFETLGLVAAGGVALLVVVVIVLFALFLRRVVPTNEVHIVQRAKTSVPYGTGYPAGNTYYHWPFWLPVVGLTKIVLPVSVFDLDLEDYDAYDKERVPFLVDIKAFFRIAEPQLAAQRISSFDELHAQLTAVVQGAVRTTLANHEIDTIMIERSKFGEYFTKEVEEQLKSWGVVTVKNIELMDIRDTDGSHVIGNIMAKRTSDIERDSRVTVAANKQKAQVAEIDAQRTVDIQKQDAEQQVGERTATKDRVVGIAAQRAEQEIATEQRETTLRNKAVEQVRNVRDAEIEKEVTLVQAAETRDKAIIIAEGDAQQTEIVARGELQAKIHEAKGIEVEGVARASAETAIQLAPVTAQITLAKEIGGNEGYQHYLISVRQVEAGQAVGIEQAKALKEADIKVISNVGTPSEGLGSVMDLFSARGGQAVGAAFEALSNTPTGKRIVDAVVN